jgi:MFS family permease
VGGDPARQTAILVVLTTTALVFSMLQSLVVPALTTIQLELGTSATATTWIVTAFFLSSAVATPILGRLGDIFGRSRMLMLSFAALIAGTAIGALSSSIEVLIAGRVVQGIAGGMMPLAFGIVRDHLPPAKVAGGIGAIAAMLAVGAALGIVLSGPIVTQLGYRWLFWIPMMVVIPAAAVAWSVIPRSARSAREPVDIRGALLLSAWLVCLLFGVTQGGSWGWASAGTLGLLIAGAALLAVWIVVELRVPVPLIDIRLMSQPMLWRVNLAGFAIGFAMQAMFTFVPQFVQIPESRGFGLGVSASNAGLVVLPWSIGAIVTGMASGRLAARFGSKWPLVAGAALTVIPGVQLAIANHEIWMICAAMAVFGVGTGLAAAAMPTIIVMFAPEHQIGIAAGMNQNIRTIGGAVGTQVVAVIIASGIGADGQASESGYIASFLVLAAVCGLATVAAIAVPSRRRQSRTSGSLSTSWRTAPSQ